MDSFTRNTFYITNMKQFYITNLRKMSGSQRAYQRVSLFLIYNSYNYKRYVQIWKQLPRPQVRRKFIYYICLVSKAIMYTTSLVEIGMHLLFKCNWNVLLQTGTGKDEKCNWAHLFYRVIGCWNILRRWIMKKSIGYDLTVIPWKMFLVWVWVTISVR